MLTKCLDLAVMELISPIRLDDALIRCVYLAAVPYAPASAGNINPLKDHMKPRSSSQSSESHSRRFLPAVTSTLGCVTARDANVTVKAPAIR